MIATPTAHSVPSTDEEHGTEVPPPPKPTNQGPNIAAPQPTDTTPSIILAVGGQKLALNPTPANTAIPNLHGAVPTTLPNSHTAIGGKGENGESLFIVDGSDTIGVPTPPPAPVTLTTLGETFTFSPLPSTVGGGTNQPVTTTLPNGHIAVGSKSPNGGSLFILDGSNTITIPAASPNPMTLTLEGETIIFKPSSPPEFGSQITATLPDGHVVVGTRGPGREQLLVLDGSATITVPTDVSTPVTLTTLGETITLLPPSPADHNGFGTTTLPDGHVAVGGKAPNGGPLIIIDGSRTITAPTDLVTPVTLTALGETITFSPQSTVLATADTTSRAASMTSNLPSKSPASPATQTEPDTETGPTGARTTGTAVTTSSRSVGSILVVGDGVMRTVVVSVAVLAFHCIAFQV